MKRNLKFEMPYWLYRILRWRAVHNEAMNLIDLIEFLSFYDDETIERNGNKIKLTETVQMATTELIDKFREFNREQ